MMTQPNSPLVGTWVGGEVGFDFEETLTFNNNGTGQWDEDSFNYTTNSNKVVIDYGDGDPETWTYSISSNTTHVPTKGEFGSSSSSLHAVKFTANMTINKVIPKKSNKHY